jgi:hypothetical protein
LTIREWRRRAARFSENTPNGGEKWRPRACPLLDEKEMIKIFVDTLKNPYFDRIVGLQLQFLVDLILVEERIEDVVKTKRMVDMPALMALVEQIAKRALMEKNKGEVQMIAKNDEKWRRTLPCYTHLESAKVGSDSTNPQGAQDLNDLLGLLRGVIFERSQQRNPRELHQDRWWFLRTCCQARIDQE